MPSSQQHVHTIRLRRPWQKQFDGQTDSIRVDVPEADSVEASQLGIATYQRQFNRPTGITPQTQVHLEIGQCRGTVHAITLNDHALNTSTPTTVDIGRRLEDHNRLTLRIGPDESGAPARLIGPVNLLIHERKSEPE